MTVAPNIIVSPLQTQTHFFHMSSKTEKPTLTGQRIRSRKRDEKSKFDPATFRDVLVAGLIEVRLLLLWLCHVSQLRLRLPLWHISSATSLNCVCVCPLPCLTG